MMEMIANTIVRNVLNSTFEQPGVNEDNLVVAIRTNASLWGVGSTVIEGYARQLRPFLPMAQDYAVTVRQRYGSFTNLTLLWLEEDKPTYYSLILNTPGGPDWLDRQVNEILKGVGITG